MVATCRYRYRKSFEKGHPAGGSLRLALPPVDVGGLFVTDLGPQP